MNETITDKMTGVSESNRSVNLYKYKNGWFTIKELAQMIPLDAKGKALSPQSLYARIKKDGIGHPNLMKPKTPREERSRLGGEAAIAAISCGEPCSRRTALKQHIKLENIPVGKYDNL